MNGAGGSVGCAVLEAGRQSRCGTVRAVFDRSAHLCADGMFFTLGRPDLAPHPYSILWPGYPDALRVGQEMRLTSEGLFSEERGWALFGEMEVFSPKRESRPHGRGIRDRSGAFGFAGPDAGIAMQGGIS